MKIGKQTPLQIEMQADLDAERTRKERSEKWRYRPVESFVPRSLKEAYSTNHTPWILQV